MTPTRITRYEDALHNRDARSAYAIEQLASAEGLTVRQWADKYEPEFPDTLAARYDALKVEFERMARESGWFTN